MMVYSNSNTDMIDQPQSNDLGYRQSIVATVRRFRIAYMPWIEYACPEAVRYAGNPTYGVSLVDLAFRWMVGPARPGR
jgi:hypothetical protein